MFLTINFFQGNTFAGGGAAQAAVRSHDAHLRLQSFVSAYHGFATLGNEHVPTPRAFDSFPPFAVDVVGATNVGGELRIQLQVPIAPVFLPERYRLLAKIEFTEPGKGRNPGLMRNFLASPFDAASYAMVTIPGVASQSQYQVHARFVLLDTETGYRSQYLQQSFLLRL